MKSKQLTKSKKPSIIIEDDKPIFIDLACGDNKQNGYIGVDVEKTPSVDIVCNLLEFPWSFAKDNSIDKLHTAHFVEHIPMVFWGEGNELSILPKKGYIDLLEKFFEECWRVLKVGGELQVIAPYYSSMRCWQDPTHRRAINDATFLYVQRPWREANKLIHCHGKSNFAVSYGYALDQSIVNKVPEYQAMAVRTQNNVVNDIVATLKKIE